MYVFLWAALVGADPAGQPAQLTRDELHILASTDATAKEAVLKKYHNELIRLTGKLVSDKTGYVLIVADPADAKRLVRLPVKITDPAARRRIDHTLKLPVPPPVTLIGWARFREMTEQVAADYVAPDRLKPKPPPAGRIESLQQAHDRLQQAIIEDGERQAAIKEDARAKGKLLAVPVYALFSLDDASDDLRRYDHAPPTPPDKEKTAAAKLALAKSLLAEPATKTAGIARLRELVRDFPDTNAAQEAKKLLRAD